jgi:N-acetylglucosaminyldiphosphoundecaprenol N-acetyl-beta-D-mannosaminyltransferase
MILDKLLTDSKEVLQKVLDAIEKEESFKLTYLNQHCYNIYCKNKDYKKLLDTKFEVYQADLGIFLALKFLFKKNLTRIDATEMNKLIMDRLIQNKIPMLIVGGKFKNEFVHNEAAKKGINLFGYQKGYFDKSAIADIIKYINISNAYVFILGMGVPKQEFFAERLSQESGTKLIICVGNFLEFYFGTKKRAPVFLQKIGFEWLFRLFTEPARLWKRYLLGIPLFLYHIIKFKITSGHEK